MELQGPQDSELRLSLPFVPPLPPFCAGVEVGVSLKKSKPRVPDKTHKSKAGPDPDPVHSPCQVSCPYSDHGWPPPLVLAPTCKLAQTPEGLKGPAPDGRTLNHASSGLSPLFPLLSQDALNLLPLVPQG